MNVPLFLSLFLLTACFTPQFPPADLSAPGWTVREVPALWKPSGEAEELAGELLWAKQPTSGELFVQFSKGGLPILTARRTSAGWTLASPLREGVHGARGNPPKMLPWFQLAELPPTDATEPWHLGTTPEGRWTLIHGRSGERLEGVGPAP